MAGWVPVDQGFARVESVGDGVDGAAHAWGVAGFELEQREHEEGRVEVGRAVAAGVAAERFVEAMSRDVRGDGVALHGPPRGLSGGGAMSDGDAERAVEGEPGHQLGVHVVGAIAADLPDPGVGLRPAPGHFVGEASHRPPCLGVEPVPGRHEQPGGVEDPAVTIELMLVGGAVADPHRSCCRVARPSSELALGSGMATVKGEQHREPWSRETARMQEPGQESAGFVGLAGAEEGADADAGVARPSEPIVPVADPAQMLRQRGRGSGYRRTRRRVGQAGAG